MAVTFTTADAGSLPYYIEGARKKTHKVLTLTGTYVTGGVDVTASDLGLNHIDWAEAVLKVNANATDSVASIDFSKTSGQAGKVVFYEESPAQISNGDTLTGATVQINAVGY